MVIQGDPTLEKALARYEDARHLANVGMWTVALQRRRLRTKEPEDEDFVFRGWADFQFFIFALIRCRRAARLAMDAALIADQMKSAIGDFDRALPNLTNIRDALEHIDEYAAGEGRNKNARQGGSVFSMVMDTPVYRWLDWEINIDEAFSAAKKLFAEILTAGRVLGCT